MKVQQCLFVAIILALVAVCVLLTRKSADSTNAHYSTNEAQAGKVQPKASFSPDRSTVAEVELRVREQLDLLPAAERAKVERFRKSFPGRSNLDIMKLLQNEVDLDALEPGVRGVDLDLAGLTRAVREFVQQSDNLPLQGGQVISKMITGGNSQGKSYYLPRDGRRGKDGSILDSWDTPFQFQFTSETVTVRSAGPNRHFFDEDDAVRTEKLIGRPERVNSQR
jgi:hypothetical protein